MSFKRCISLGKYFFFFFLILAFFPSIALCGNYTLVVVPVVASALEGSPLKFQVQRQGAFVDPGTRLVVTLQFSNWSAVNGADFTAVASDTLVFYDATTSIDVEIPTLADALIETNETVIVTLSSPNLVTTNPADYGTIDLGPLETVTIEDNTLQVSIVSGMTPYSVAENAGTNQTVKVVLSRISPHDVTVDYDLSGGAQKDLDFTIAPSSYLTIPAGAVEGLITVTPLDDLIVEHNETYRITLNTLTTDDLAAIVPLAHADGEISSEDIFEMTLNGPVPADVYENAIPADYPAVTIKLTNPVAWDMWVHFNFLTVAGDAVYLSDYTLSEDPVRFPAGKTTATFQIVPKDDTEIESDELFKLGLSTTGLAPEGSIGAVNIVSGKILDNDYNITVTSSSPSEGLVVSTDFAGVSIPPDIDGTILVVDRNSTPKFDVTSEVCYHIADVTVDSASVGSWSNPDVRDNTTFTYVFDPVVDHHAFHADFDLNIYSITSNILNPDNGSVTVSSSSVDCGSNDHSIKATANTGYYITWFKVNGVKQTAAYNKTEFEYIANNVNTDLAIEVAFSNKVVLTNSSPNGSVTSVSHGTSDVINVDYGTPFLSLYIGGEDHAVQGPGAIVKTAKRNSTTGVCTDPDTGVVLTKPVYNWSGVLQNTPVVDDFCNYIDTGGKLIYETPGDVRTHSHHLSKVNDNSTEKQAYCRVSSIPPITSPLDPADPFYAVFTETDYTKSAECLYVLENITEDHDVEVLFTSFIDLRNIGQGEIKQGSMVLVDGLDGVSRTEELEVQANASVTISFAPDTDWYVGNVQLRKEAVEADRRVEGISNIPEIVSLGGRSSYTFAGVIDQDWGIQSTFKVNELTLQATSTFEKVLFTDTALTDPVTKTNANDKKIVEVNTDGSFYVVINDPDYAVVGLAIDSIFIDMKKILEYEATPSKNPDSAIFTFVKGSVGTKQYLEIRFNKVIVSHNVEVRDYDGVIISDLPLDAQVAPNPPAIMFVLDDSGSMDWEFMVKSSGSGTYYSGKDVFNDDNSPDKEFYYVYDFPFSRLYSSKELGGDAARNEWRSRFADYNGMFYKPSVIYSPWPTFTGTLELGSASISSQLPAVASFTDKRAHADMYRPRYHPWHNTDCATALEKSTKKRNGENVSSIDTGTCDNNQTLNFDGTYLAIGAGVPGTLELDENDASRSDTWENRTEDKCYNGDYSRNTGGGSATWKFTPSVTGLHSVEVSWREYFSRSTNVKYSITCSTCSPAVNATVSKDQTKSAYYAEGMSKLGDYTFQIGKEVTVKVERASGSSGSISIDAVRVKWTPVAAGLENIINAHYFTWDDANGDKIFDSGESVWLVNLTDPITYTKLKDKDEPVGATNIETPLAGTATLPTTLVTFADPKDPLAFVLERQNFADWFSYYRSRALSATAGMSLAIEKMQNVQVGIKSINYTTSYGISQSVLPVNVWGERDKSKYLYYLLYDFKSKAEGTPLRSGFYNVARYFDAQDNNSGGVVDTVKQSGITTTGADDLSPFAKVGGVEKNGDRCKDVFSIIVTDGYWNEDSTYDSYDAEVSYAVVPTKLKKIYNHTLADTAYNYYVIKDLMNDASGGQQSMLTYGVAFGVTGDLTYNAQCSFADPSTCPSWNEPHTGDKSTVDDLWHASVNGGGEFISASSPDTLVEALSSIVENIRDLEGSSASLAASGDELYVPLDDKVRMYQPSWNTKGWYGDLKSYAVDTKTGKVDSTPLWSAAETLSKRLSGTATGAKRIIATYNPTTKTGVPFAYASLTADQKSQLTPYYSPTKTSSDVVEFLRGDSILAGSYCLDGTCFPDFRDRSYVDNLGVSRTHVLGDIVNSQGAFHDYFSAGTSIGGIIFIGANDGMLHAFSAKDEDYGKELFAYVPNLVFHNLRTLADPKFASSTHKMFVDATPVVQEISQGTTKKTILVGGLGKGGRGYFGLDMTDARSITTEAGLATRVLWEFPKPPEKILNAVSASFSVDKITLATALTDTQRDKILISNFITVLGANYSSGSLRATNDGTYEVSAISADKKIITITKPDFSAMSSLTISLFESIADHDMGYSFSHPSIVKTNDTSIGYGGWVVVFSNGYGSDSGTANLYILDPLTGEQIKDTGGVSIGKIETKAGPLNGLSTAKIIDVDNNLTADYAYAGDLLGNMWKFDLFQPTGNATGPAFKTADYWQVAFCANGSDVDHCRRDVSGMTPKPLFSSLLKQPITGAPDVMRHQTRTGYMVIFGTGKYLGWIDLVSADLQSLYGIWDWAPDYYDKGYLGTRADNVVGGVTHVELTNWTQKDILGAPMHSLLKQEVLFEGEISEDANNDGTFSAKEDVNGNGVKDVYSYYRIPTSFTADWSLASNDKLTGLGQTALPYTGSLKFKVPLANLGWTFDLPGKIEDGVHTEGERMVNDTIIRDGKAIMITFGLSGDKCGASAYSFINERNANSGGMLFRPVFDMNGDGVVNGEDSIYFLNTSDGSKSGWLNATDKSTSGRVSNPVIGVRDPGPDGNPIEDKYMSNSAITKTGGGGAVIEHLLESAERLGVFYWKQVE